MQVDRVSGFYSHQLQSTNPKINEFETLWNEWFKHPTQQTGEKLYAFLEKNEGYFEKLTNGKPVPAHFPKGTPFSHYYNAALTYLKGWMTHGCQPGGTTPVSEWLNDISIWINEK